MGLDCTSLLLVSTGRCTCGQTLSTVPTTHYYGPNSMCILIHGSVVYENVLEICLTPSCHSTTLLHGLISVHQDLHCRTINSESFKMYCLLGFTHQLKKSLSEFQSWELSDSLLWDFHHSLSMLLHCLESLSFAFNRLCLTVLETQHIAIEMHAIIDYITVYRPHMLATNIPPSTTADPEFIGVFTMDPVNVEEFFRARIPVWLLLKLDQLSFPQTDAHIASLKPSKYLLIEFSKIQLWSVFIRVLDQTEKYKAFQLFTCNYLRLLNPFALTPWWSSFEPSSARARAVNINMQQAM